MTAPAIACAPLLSLCLLLPLCAQAHTLEEGRRLKAAQDLAGATQAFTAVLAAEPTNLEAQQELATVLGWQHRFSEAAAAWQQAAALAPDDPAPLLGLARVRYWQGERSEAIGLLQRSLAANPAQAEAESLLGDVLLADGQRAAARAAYQRAQALAPADDTLPAKLLRAAPPLRWRLDAGLTIDDYDNFRGRERSQFAQLGRQVSERGTVLYARYDGYDSFGAIDQSLTLGGYWLPTATVLINAEAGRTLGTADFRPRTQLSAQGEWLRAEGLQPLLGVRLFDYAEGSVTTLTPGIRLEWAGQRDTPPGALELRYGLTDNLDGSTTGVFSARLTLPQPHTTPYVSFTTGRESLPPQAKASIVIVGAGVVWAFSPAWGFRLDYSYEDRKNIYKHHALGGGLTYRF